MDGLFIMIGLLVLADAYAMVHGYKDTGRFIPKYTKITENRKNES